MGRARRRIGVAAASLVLTVGVFALAELAVRIAGVAQPEWPGASWPFSMAKGDPILGPLPRPGWAGKWMGGFTVAIDPDGFRTTGLPALEAPQARVAFLGDSCTFGWGLDTPDTFIARLDGQLRADGKAPIELINAAFPGHSAVLGEQVLRDRVLPLRPDLVVLGYSANNAFRFSVVTDADRLRHVGLRRVLLRSRIFYILAARLARWTALGKNPRDTALVNETPAGRLRRVATPDEFAAAERAAVEDARAAGAGVLFLIFPRASEVSPAYPGEDPARLARSSDGDLSGDRPLARGLLEVSCLDPGPKDVFDELRARLPGWQPVYPDDAALRAVLVQGARTFVSDDFVAALDTFRAAVSAWPESPLAHYDLAVAAFMSGDSAAGLHHLGEAERLSCNVFLRYQAILWRLADELHVPVVDLTLPLQAYDGAPLFIDPAHPNAAAAQIIAGALAAPIARQLGPVLAERGAE